VPLVTVTKVLRFNAAHRLWKDYKLSDKAYADLATALIREAPGPFDAKVKTTKQLYADYKISDKAYKDLMVHLIRDGGGTYADRMATTKARTRSRVGACRGPGRVS